MQLKIRCSSLSKIMAKAKDGELSKGAETYIYQLAKEHVYQYRTNNSSKYTEKGIAVEDESIMLLNDLMMNRGEFIEYEKNTIRYTNEYLTGEPDIVASFQNISRDIKSSWGLDTFPASSIDALRKTNASDYEWQGRGYMLLLNENDIKVDRHLVDYCLTNTPDYLINPYSDEETNFDRYPLEMRITTISYERDVELEQLIKEKCLLAQIYFDKQVEIILSEKGLTEIFKEVA